ncbi:MAG: winged helix-turn-helix domain-containing protein [Candidatus Dojkabacteria bacterium]|nr:MAG: winged helix-turn-helix domain-containing protein [Candidatus Dojkabacteria bacterium]
MKTRKELRQQVVSLLPNGNYITLVGMNGSGKSDFLRQLDDENRETNPNNAIVLVRASALIDITVESFYGLLISTMLDVLGVAYEDSSQALLSKDLYKLNKAASKIISEYLLDKEKSVTIVVTNIDRYAHLGPQFYMSLRGLREQDINRIGYIFTGNTDLLRKLTRECVGSFEEVLNALVLRLSVDDYQYFEEVIESAAKRYKYPVTKEEKKHIHSIAGGHASFIKYTVQYLLENGECEVNNLLEYEPIKTRIMRLVDEMGSDLYRYYSTTEPSNMEDGSSELDQLIKAGFIIKPADGGYADSIPILRAYSKTHPAAASAEVKVENADIQGESNHTKSDPEVRDGNIYFDGETIGDELSEREFELLSLFVQNYGKVVTRDDVAEILWKSRSIEKYSDWAIDQTISRLRKKLPQGVTIKTIKGRGFKLGR